MSNAFIRPCDSNILIRPFSDRAATGIGAATAIKLVRFGINVVFGDTNTKAAEELVQSLTIAAKENRKNGKVVFVPCDVTNYGQLYELFRTAYDQFGKIDHAVSNAGIFEQGNWFDPALTIESVGQAGPGPTNVIDINVIGMANFARIAVVFLRENKTATNKSLTFMSSVNCFRESPGLYMYQVSLDTSIRGYSLRNTA